MKNQLLIFSIFFAAVLAWAGYYSYPTMVMWLLPDASHVQYMITSPSDLITDALCFGLACALIPLVLYFIWNLTQTTDRSGRTLSGFILVFVSASAIFIHYWIIHDLIAEAAKISTGIKSGFDLGSLMYHFYLLVGELIGGTVAFYVLKKRKRLV